MDVSTEIFALAIFVIALPVLILIFKPTNLPGAKWFLAAYICLLLSNTFSVIESWVFYDISNFLEHIFTAISSVLFFIAIRIFTTRRADSQPNSAKRFRT